MSSSKDPRPVRSPLKTGGLGLLVVALAGGVGFLIVMKAGWPREMAFMAAIAVLAAGLWVTEVVPLYATALLVLLLELVLLANPGDWPGLGFSAGHSPSSTSLIHAAADPILLLFFGGLLMARACVNEGVDRLFCRWLLLPFGRRPAPLLLGVLLMTAVLSMWMSNTATAALAVTLVAPIAAGTAVDDPLRKGLYLAIPVGANLGGLGTPIASPPNAVAVRLLHQSGIEVGFGSWMLVALPVMLACLLVSWGLLLLWYRPKTAQVELLLPPQRLNWRGRVVLGTFFVTVALWLTGSWHGVPASTAALLPAVVLGGLGIVSRKDVDGIEWNVLILISGGIALGAGMQLSGLDDKIVELLPPSNTTSGLLVLLSGSAALGALMSNTAAANLILPVAVASAAAMAGEGNQSVLLTAFAVTFAVGTSMLLPGSTPPNAIAYASGAFTSRDLLKVGLAVSILTIAVSVLLGEWLVSLLRMT
jgi:solute carrier family 13 (sodium-dependent dicarboxylate transporter), member 2/3/5